MLAPRLLEGEAKWGIAVDLITFCIAEGYMFKKWSIAFGLGVAATSLCITLGTSKASADTEVEPFADAFLGNWTFQSGSAATSPCLSSPIDLTGATGSITAGSSAGHITATVQGCAIPFTESDASHATLSNNTNCTFTDPSSGTSYSVSITKGSLSLANGVLSVSGSGTADIFCSITLKGTATQ